MMISTRGCYFAICLIVSVGLLAIGWTPLSAQEVDSVKQRVATTLRAAEKNREELEKVLQDIEPEFKVGAEFLLAYMPHSDAKKLSSEFLLEHIRGAYEAWIQSPWHAQISEDIFLNNILPYASVSERREAWRADFRKRFLPMVESVKNPSEAAVLLNQKIFRELGVKYSTKRKRPDQGPYESIESGKASCTGLSILLIDACRAVGVPARFVGIPRWTDNSGNHSWVEIWDGEWKFTGAAEPSGDDLNKGWFVERATKAKANQPIHSIYAVSYRGTDTRFPIVWDRSFDPFWASNVTERYTKKKMEIGENQVLVRVKAVDAKTKERVVAKFSFTDQKGNTVFEGQTKNESFDSNDHANVLLEKNTEYVLLYNDEGREETEAFTTTDSSPKKPFVFQVGSSGDADASNDKVATEAVSITKAEAAEMAASLWAQHRKELAKDRAPEMQTQRIKLPEFDDLEMKYAHLPFGEKPENGHALYISMHGGGGTRADVNERQWMNQIRLYQPTEGIYVAPRAPTDTWNLWHRKHIDAFFDRIIENFVASGLVDPNRVYLMGYSAGGDGVYQLGPRMADRFAAAAMMAGHPNETKPFGLRNLPFAIYVGGKDTSYNRSRIAGEWKTKLAALRESDPDGYKHQVTIYPDKGHWMDREDASALPWMAQNKRDVWPKKIVWYQDDVTHDRFYWLSVPNGSAKKKTTVTAAVEGQKIILDSEDVSEVRIWLHDRLLDLDQEIELVVNGKASKQKVARTEGAIKASFESRPDFDMMAPAFIDVKIE